MMSNTRFAHVGIFLALFLFLSAVGMGAAGAYDIRWGTAPAGGTWQALGTAMLEDVLKTDPGLKGSTMPIGGAANVVAVDQGKLNVAFSFSNTAGEAWEGKEFFEKQGQLRKTRELAVLFPEPTQIAVWADSDIKEIGQLKGKKVTPGPKGSAIATVSKYVLGAYGMTFDDIDTKYLSFDEAGQQMTDGHIDCIFYGAMAFPAPPIISANSQRQVRLLSMPPDSIVKVIKDHKGLEPYTLPAGSYKGVDYPTQGVAANVVVIGSADMPDNVAYAIVKTIAENFERYGTVMKSMTMGKKEDMGKFIGIPFHPGALKFYQEKGWAK